ncbi:MAG: periplasmic heavy metal sensor [Bryobacteraceae bacterium]|nr:periplasmic heavy metal sensor [Bryobacteraceae bacterium]
MMLRVLPLFVFAAVLAAQPGPGRGGPMGPRGGGEALKSALSLTDDQVTKLRELRKAQFDETKSVLQKLRENRASMRTLLDQGSDAAAIGNLVLASKTLREQIRDTNASYHKQAVAVLNATQQETLKKIEEAAGLVPAIGQARALNLLERPAGGGPEAGGMMGMPGGRPFDGEFGPRRLRR